MLMNLQVQQLDCLVNLEFGWVTIYLRRMFICLTFQGFPCQNFALYEICTHDLIVIILICLLNLGSNTSRRNANITYHTSDVSILLTPWPIWIQRTYYRLASRYSTFVNILSSLPTDLVIVFLHM